MKWPEHKPFDIRKRSILVGYVGSISHGTTILPKDGGIDDKDVMGFCIPPREYYFGLEKFEQLAVWVDEYDIVIYEARKLFRLLLNCNPNVLGLLWLQPTYYIVKNEWGERLIEGRDMFSSKQAYKAFTGYAHSQLKRMTHLACQGYMGAKRKNLVQQFGYDTKNAAHLIRLLRMGIEFLASGELNVQRHDAPQLIDIKQGKYKLEDIKVMADDLFSDASKAFITSQLPTKPDTEKANELLVSMIGAIK